MPRTRENNEALKPDSNGQPTADAPPSLDDLDELRDCKKKLARTIAVNAEVSRLHAEHLEAAETAKAAKKAWEAAADQLQGLIRGFAQPMPLFDRPREAIPPEQKPPAAEPWREVAVDVLRNHGLSQAIVEHLDENDFKTIGHLADWTTQDNALTAIAGIGKAKAEKIEQALESFWASQQTAPEQPAAEATGDELEEDWLTDETEESTDE